MFTLFLVDKWILGFFKQHDEVKSGGADVDVVYPSSKPPLLYSYGCRRVGFN
jgi:hypothetical protein